MTVKDRLYDLVGSGKSSQKKRLEHKPQLDQLSDAVKQPVSQPHNNDVARPPSTQYSESGDILDAITDRSKLEGDSSHGQKPLAIPDQEYNQGNGPFTDHNNRDKPLPDIKKPVTVKRKTIPSRRKFVKTKVEATAPQLTTDPAKPVLLRSQSEKSEPARLLETRYSGIWNWIPRIPQSADDATVVRKIKGVLGFADRFISNFFDNRLYNGEIPDTILATINYSPHFKLIRDLQEELSEADYRLPLLKHLLIARLLRAISYESPPSETSLLPREFQTYAILVGAEGASTVKGVEGEPDRQAKYSAYRVLCANIRSSIQNDDNYLTERDHVIDTLIEDIEDAMGFFARSAEDVSRIANLKQLLEKAADLGIFLFSQPSVFQFNWEIPIRSKSIATWPRTLRVWDDDGQMPDLADVLIPMKFDVVNNDDIHDSDHASVSAQASLAHQLQKTPAELPAGTSGINQIAAYEMSTESSHSRVLRETVRADSYNDAAYFRDIAPPNTFERSNQRRWTDGTEKQADEDWFADDSKPPYNDVNPPGKNQDKLSKHVSGMASRHPTRRIMTITANDQLSALEDSVLYSDSVYTERELDTDRQVRRVSGKSINPPDDDRVQTKKPTKTPHTLRKRKDYSCLQPVDLTEQPWQHSLPPPPPRPHSGKRLLDQIYQANRSKFPPGIRSSHHHQKYQITDKQIDHLPQQQHQQHHPQNPSGLLQQDEWQKTYAMPRTDEMYITRRSTGPFEYEDVISPPERRRTDTSVDGKTGYVPYTGSRRKRRSFSMSDSFAKWRAK